MGRLSIKSKLLMMLLGVSLVSVALVAYMAFRSGNEALIEAVFKHLTSVRASKAYQIESYLENVRSQVETLGEDHMIAEAAQEFSEAYRSLSDTIVEPGWDEELDSYYRDEFLPRLQANIDGSPVFETYRPTSPPTRYLQYHYVAANPHEVGDKDELSDAGDGSAYSAIHRRYHPIFRHLVEEFGYYDMFLIDPNTGTIVYSVYKETDYATSLREGPYRNTNLAATAHAVQETPDKGTVRMIDFAPYRPSYAAPAAFVATPIYDGPVNTGILAFQVPVDEINKIMTGDAHWERDGLGESGETYLVGPDYRMRSISRFLIDDPEGYARDLRSSGVPESQVSRILRLGTSILQQEVRTDAAEEAMKGHAGTEIVDDYRGIPVLSSFAPLQVPDVSWVILSEMDLAEAYGPVNAFTRRMLISAVLLMLGVTLLAMLLASSFVRPIQRLAEAARRVAGGETGVSLDSGSQDELGDLGRTFGEMLDSVRGDHAMAEERSRENEELLLNILPKAVATRLMSGEETISDSFENVTVCFADLVGFTRLSREIAPRESVAHLNDLVSSFDEAAENHGIEKIKTIGDNYMAACGLSTSRLDHAKRMVDLSLEMQGIVRRYCNEHGLDLSLRIGIHCGPLVAGVIGRQKFVYDVWGETVNRAHRLTDVAEPGEVLVSQAVADAVRGLHEVDTVERGSKAGAVFAVREGRAADSLADDGAS